MWTGKPRRNTTGFTDWRAPNLQEWATIAKVLGRSGIADFGRAYWSGLVSPKTGEHYAWMFRGNAPALVEMSISWNAADELPIRAVQRFS